MSDVAEVAVGLVYGAVLGLFAGMLFGVWLTFWPPHTNLQTRYEHVLRVTGYDDSRDVVVSIAGERVVIPDPTQPKGEVK